MCLIIGKENETCTHEWCRLAAKKPQYWAIFKADYLMNDDEVRQFKFFPGYHYGEHEVKPHLLIVNPYDSQSKLRSDFEFFRQSMHNCTDAHGHWPTDRDVFHKSEIAFIFIEENVSRRAPINTDGGGEWIDSVDLTEVAIYIGKEAVNA